jgi:hypothetical protein
MARSRGDNPKFWRHALSTPFIWGIILPGLLLHAGIFLYQVAAFRLYEIEPVHLRDYVNFDREKLAYLSLFDKFNCLYCSYMNGLFPYVTEVARKTEYYWCGVKHHDQPTNPAFAYQEKFAKYGSEDDFNRVLVASGRRAGPHK